MIPVLSIDFDFWIPVRPELRPRSPEMGGEEDVKQWKLRLTQAAKTGTDLRREIRLAPKEWPTPDRLASWLTDRRVTLDPNGIGVMDQHLYAFDHFSDLNDVWLVHVDAHHDMGYPRVAAPLHCGNWIQRLVEKGVVRKVTVIYPVWRTTKRYQHSAETLENILDAPWLASCRFDLLVRHGLFHMPEGIHFQRTAIARSGCWSPPWLDDQFNRLVASLTDHPSRVYEPTPVRQVDYALTDQCGKALGLREQMGLTMFQKK